MSKIHLHQIDRRSTGESLENANGAANTESPRTAAVEIASLAPNDEISNASSSGGFSYPAPFSPLRPQAAVDRPNELIAQAANSDAPAAVTRHLTNSMRIISESIQDFDESVSRYGDDKTPSSTTTTPTPSTDTDASRS